LARTSKLLRRTRWRGDTSYVLVSLVQPGDIVVHYDSRQEAIVGVSVASSAAEPAPIYWVSRGSYRVAELMMRVELPSWLAERNRTLRSMVPAADTILASPWVLDFSGPNRCGRQYESE
jgi:hypothetical protein